MKKLILIALMWASAATAASDGYTFKNKMDYNKSEVLVEFVVVPSRDHLRSRAEEMKVYVPEDQKLRAFSVLRKDRCIIYMVDPKRDYAPEDIGHELMHCKYGRWH